MGKKSRVNYRPNRPGTGQLLRTEEMEQLVARAANKAKAHAEKIAPRDTGRYAASFEVESTRRGGPNSDRAEAHLINTANHAWAVEFVNGDRVLGKAADHIEHAED
jgi:hypothetical protein